MKNTWLVLLILIASFFLLSYKLTQVPPGINGDEAAIAYNAVLVAKTGRVEIGNRFPLFIPTGSDWKQPVTFYSTVAAFKIFGPSYEGLRGVSIFFALTSMVLLFFLVKETLGTSAGIVALLLFLATPLILIQSHLALENIAPIPFVIFWLWMLIRFTKSKDMKFLVFAGMALGAGVFSYYGMRLIVPVLLLLSLVFIKKVKPGLAFLAGTTPFLLLLIWAYFRYPGAVFGNNTFTPITSYQQFFLPYLSIFDPTFLFLKGDATIYHSTGTTGMFLLATLPLFILGLILAIREKASIYRFILASFFLSPILYGLVGESYRASRLLAIVPFYILVSTLGFSWIFKLKSRLVRWAAVTGFAVLILGNYTNFATDYWFYYPNRVKKEFSAPYQTAFESLKSYRDKNYKVLIQKEIWGGGDALKFFREVYFPSSIGIWSKGEDIPGGTVLFADYSFLTENEKKNLKVEGTQIKDYGLFIKEGR